MLALANERPTVGSCLGSQFFDFENDGSLHAATKNWLRTVRNGPPWDSPSAVAALADYSTS
ncbi:hypothetical protein [Rhizobium ruizarguesonis]|uniref:hypothetical protein n=1 Tax=Rhizobium ruizarguesonis TaxID=2081791 RepID=UPI001447FD1A|nr:hypothetical protein [Rhizobium ruizarguesonis]NKQ85186.1 hypothetical protein [Rhizobium ruizarguesonis]